MNLAEIFNNFWLLSIFVFIVTIFMDYFWAVCVKHVSDENAVAAANHGVYFWLTTVFLTVSYVKDPWLTIPLLAGTWVGTYIAVKYPRQGMLRAMWDDVKKLHHKKLFS